jgi:hypothetical protein
LIEAVTDLVTRGELALSQDGLMITDAAKVRSILQATLENHLRMLARWSLLVG